ncbi:MAG: hypothetical protein HY762_00975, partial [Planctomycetes bacterium]|nr:hypothetical protein [Planctomycetota bacterium]
MVIMKHALVIGLCAVIWCCVASRPSLSAQENLVISEANYDVQIKDNQATATLNFTATVIDGRWAEVALSPLSAETSLQSAPAEVTLLKDARNNKLIFKQKGTYSVRCRIILPVSASGQLKKITLQLVPATFGGITVTIPVGGDPATYSGEGGIDAVVSPPVTCEKKVHKSYTTLNINSPLADELTVTWGPEAVMKQPYDATVNSASYVWIEKGLMTYNHSFTIAVGQQPLKSFRIALPPNVRLTKFTGSTQTAVGIEKWTTLTANAKDYVEVTLDSPIYAAVFQGTLSCEQTVPAISSGISTDPDSANLTILPLEISGLPTATTVSGQAGPGKQGGKLTLVAADNYLIDEESVENLVRQNVYEATMTKIGKRLFYPYIYTGLPARLVLRARPKEPLVSATLETLYHLRPNSLQAVSRLVLDVRNTPIDTVTLKYRPDSLSNNFFIKGDRVKNYRVIKDRIEVIFTEKFTGTTTLQIEAAQDTPADAKLVFTPVEVVGAQENQSYTAVKLDEVECTVAEILKATQIDPAQLPDWLAGQKPSLAFVSSAPAWELAARVAPLAPAVTAVAIDNVQIIEDVIQRVVALALSIKKSSLFSMTLKLPQGVRPVEVTSPLLKEWTYNQQTGMLQITFNTGLKVDYPVGLKLEGDISATDSLILLPLEITAPAPRQLEYYLAISAPRDIILVPTLMVGIQEISINKLPRTPSDTRLGFHSVQPQWTLEVRKTVEPTHLLANISAGLIAREGQVRVINAINYRVKSGSVRRLRLKLPPHALNTEITGENIKNRSNSDNLWEIDLASRVTRGYTLYVQYEQTEPVFTPIETLDAELESGLVVVSAGSERTEVGYGADSRNAQPVPVSEAEPKIAQSILGQMPSAPSLAVSFTKPDARANFIIKTHELGAILPAKVVSCDLFSLQQTNGKLLTYFNTMIENTAKQYLEVKLPTGATLWGAYVDDKPVKAVTREAGQMMIPIASAVTTTQTAKTDKRQLSVVVAYVQEAGALGHASNINLVMPQSDINIQGATWHLFLPEGYYVTSPAGNMELVYSDPQISYPSLPALAYDGLSSYLSKLYWAIPAWVKTLFWYLMLLVVISVSIIFLIWILTIVFSYLRLDMIPLRRVAFTFGAGLIITLAL